MLKKGSSPLNKREIIFYLGIGFLTIAPFCLRELYPNSVFQVLFGGWGLIVWWIVLGALSWILNPLIKKITKQE